VVHFKEIFQARMRAVKWNGDRRHEHDQGGRRLDLACWRIDLDIADHELGAGILCGAHSREESLIPGRVDHHAELAVEFGGQLVRIAHDDDAARRIVTEKPCDIGHRHTDRL
jgi:hypothetical protein